MAADAPPFAKWLVAGIVVLVVVLVGGYWFVADATAIDPVVRGGSVDRGDSAPVAVAESAPMDGPDPGPAAANGAATESGRAESLATPLSGPWVLAVRAVDSLGDPVPAAEMELWRSLADVKPFQEGHVDGDGVGRMFVRDESVFVRVRHADFGDSVRVRVSREAAPADPMPLMLLRAALVRGLVLDSEGAPLVGVTVKVKERWKGGAITQSNLTAEEFLTDRDGRFQLDCVVGTTIELVVDEPELFLLAADSLLVTQPCEVLLAGSGAFQVGGTIIDASGRPVSGSVRATEWELGYWSGLEPASAASSTFAVALNRAGRHVVHATVPGHMARSIEVMLSLQQRHRTVEFVAHPTMATRGTVVDESGKPVVGEILVATPDDPEWGQVMRPLEDGSFDLPLVAPTGWTLSLQGLSGDALRCRAGDTELRFVAGAGRVGPRRSTVGVDVFAVDGVPPRHAVFTLIRGKGSERTVETVRTRGDLPRVTLDVPSLRERWLLLAEDPFTKHAGHVWVEADDRPLRLVLEPLVPVEVIVRRAGRPVRGVTVRVEPCGGSEKARVDANGVARIGGVPHGPATVRVLRGNEELAAKDVLLRTRDFAFVTIDLP